MRRLWTVSLDLVRYTWSLVHVNLKKAKTVPQGQPLGPEPLAEIPWADQELIDAKNILFSYVLWNFQSDDFKAR